MKARELLATGAEILLGLFLGWAAGSLLRLSTDLTLVLAALLAGLVVWVWERWVFGPWREVARCVERLDRMLPEDEPAGFDPKPRALIRRLRALADRVQQSGQRHASTQNLVEAVLAGMTEGVLVVDSRQRVCLVNQALVKLFGASDGYVGRLLFEFIRHPPVQEAAVNVFASADGRVVREVALLHPEERHLLLHGALLPPAGETRMAVLVFLDITPVRRLERMRREFVAQVSHELRTPLASIRGYAETLLDGALDDRASASDFLRIIHDASLRLTAMVEDLLHLSRLESGLQSLPMRAEPVRPLVARVLDLLAPLARRQGVELVCDVPETLPALQGNEPSLVRALLNVGENAVKYNRAGGRVTFSVRHRSPWIEVSVADTGIGIPEADRERVFERFYRVDPSRSPETGGAGLGLAIVKHIVLAHGGQVRLESELGRGSVFVLHFPAA